MPKASLNEKGRGIAYTLMKELSHFVVVNLCSPLRNGEVLQYSSELKRGFLLVVVFRQKIKKKKKPGKKRSIQKRFICGQFFFKFILKWQQ